MGFSAVRMPRGFCHGLLALVLTCGCVSEPETPAEPRPDPTTTQPPVDPVPTALPEVVARVDRYDITRDELERAVRSAEIQAGQALPTQFRDQVYRTILDRLVSFHLLVYESETRRILIDEATVDARIAEIQSGFPSPEAFDDQLASWNTSRDRLRDETKRDLLVERVLESAVYQDLNIDADTVRGFYEQHVDQFTENGGVRARHILIGASPDAESTERAEARQRAEQLRLEAEGGADFAELAQEHSEDPGSAANGGDLGLVVPGQTVTAFEEALFSLEPGKLSEVVETPFGFHVIQLTERLDARTVPFDEAHEQIRGFLVEQEQQARTTAFIEELKTKYAVEILI